MAIVTFGNTTRANDSIAFLNKTPYNLVFALLHGASVMPNHVRFMTLMDFDNRLRGTNLRNNTLFSVNSDGKTPYLDDVSELAKLIVTGQIQIYTATYSVSGGSFTANTSMASANIGGFTLGSAAATSFVGGDGSVIFS